MTCCRLLPSHDYVNSDKVNIILRIHDTSMNFMQLFYSVNNYITNISPSCCLPSKGSYFHYGVRWVYYTRNFLITGNDKLHYLLSQGNYELRFDMEDFENQTRYVKYSSFSVGDEASKYTVSISGYTGNVGTKKITRYSYENVNNDDNN